MRTRAFRGLEKRRESRVIGLIHRQETMAFLGFPVARYIDIEDSEAAHEAKVTVFVPHPAASLIKVVEQKPIAEIDDQTLIETDQARKSLTQVETFVRKILEERMGEKAAPLA